MHAYRVRTDGCHLGVVVAIAGCTTDPAAADGPAGRRSSPLGVGARLSVAAT